jgi:glycosyltransferase involved in cell wall biosynthesis
VRGVVPPTFVPLRPAPDAPPARPARPRVAFVVNGGAGSAMGIRARSFAERLADRFDLHTLYRTGGRLGAARRFFSDLRATRPAAVYVLDVVAPSVLAALAFRRLTGAALIVDTGDAVGAIARQLGRGRAATALSDRLERAALDGADRLVVRGSYHAVVLGNQGHSATVIPDGVDPAQFRPVPTDDLRKTLGLDGHLVVGAMGSSVWNARLGTCYGFELPDVLAALRDRPVKALFIGGGGGVEHVQAKARALGVADRLVCVGPKPYDELPAYLCALDVAVSTQTDDLVGRVRTTGKLPLYLACGRFVLSTRVGEAARVLPEAMLVDYAGSSDPAYPPRLAARVADLLAHPERLDVAASASALARRHFGYDRLAERAADVIDAALAARRPRPAAPSAVLTQP